MYSTYRTNSTEKVISDTGSLAEFYNLTTQLSKTRFVRFTGKQDEADNIEWRFVYRGHKLVLQYNIYSGVLLFTENEKNNKALDKLATKLRANL